MRSVLFVLSLFAGTSSAAQDRLTLSADLVLFPEESTIYAWNETESEVVLDSLGVRFSGPRAWFIRIVASDTLIDLFDLSPAYDSTASIGLIVKPSQAVEIQLVGFDPCIICKREAWNPNQDTLFVYSGGSDRPGKVVLDVTNWVAVEDPVVDPADAPDLRLFPNPADRVVTIKKSEAVALKGELLDLLGRVVEHLDDAGSSSISLDVSSLPPGVYLLRTRLEETHVLVRTIVVAR